MTVVYIDSLFLLNLIVDYLLLLGAARLSGAVLCRPRMALGAVLGAAYACAVFLPGLGFLTHPAVELSIAVAMALIAYGGGQRLLRSFLAFLALSCALGGGVLALSLLGARGWSGVSSLPMWTWASSSWPPPGAMPRPPLSSGAAPATAPESWWRRCSPWKGGR